MPYSSKQEINKLVENLGQFGMFKVTTDKGVEFMTTEIVSNMDVFLEFRRLFASSVYTNNAVIGIEYVSKTVVICKTSTTTYTITFEKKTRKIDPGVVKWRAWNIST